MNYFIIGLGNPEQIYENTRHNAGQILLEQFRRRNNFPTWKYNKKMHAKISEDRIGKKKVYLVLPQTHMNESGISVRKIIPNASTRRRLVVIHDEMDLPRGTFKISYARGSAGHKGVESIVRSLRSRDFIRVRVGVGLGHDRNKHEKNKTLDFLLGPLTKKERASLLNISQGIDDALTTIVMEGVENAMTSFN